MPFKRVKGTRYSRVYVAPHRKRGITRSNDLSPVIGGAVYGAVRGSLMGITAPLWSRLNSPYAAPAVMGILGYVMRKKGGYMGKVARAALTVESANLTSRTVAPMLSGAIGGLTGGSTNAPQEVFY